MEQPKLYLWGGILLKQAMITIKSKIIEKKRIQAYKNFIIFKGKKTK